MNESDASGANMRTLLTMAVIAAPALAMPAQASVYSDATLERERPRLKRAVTRIYNLGIKPSLTARERDGLGRVAFEFPMPQPDDDVLNFYAGRVDGTAKVIFPLQSLKMIEDLATAFAWLYDEKRGFGPIDVYFAMLQRKPFDAWGRARRPNILEALGVPKNILKNKAVDRLSLSLRNEAIAFITVHELGHVLFRHKGVNQITPAQARADEVQSDAFALDVLGRTGTPPLGAVIFFQAQIFSLPHRGEFKTRAAWSKYLETASTHPLSVDRINAMARMIAGPLARRRPNERAVWQGIGLKLRQVADTLADIELHNCMVKVAERAPVSLLKSPDKAERAAMRRYCVER